jgi:divalent metal cation (Fe/Co/Zn/Cd) transporter
MRSLLIGEAARPAEYAKIAAAISGAPQVQELVHLRTQHLGPDELLVGAKVLFADGLSTDGLADAINGIEDRVRAEVPHARPMYVEPAVDRASYRPDPPAGPVRDHG